VRTFLKRWVAEGPTHHFAIGTGNQAGVIRQIGEILGLETAIVASGAKKD
jgi:L-arabinose isomerase